MSYETTLALLIVALVVVCIAGAGLMKLIDGIKMTRFVREDSRRFWRSNANQAIIAMIEEDSDAGLEMLRRVFADSLGEYRKLS